MKLHFCEKISIFLYNTALIIFYHFHLVNLKKSHTHPYRVANNPQEIYSQSMACDTSLNSSRSWHMGKTNQISIFTKMRGRSTSCFVARGDAAGGLEMLACRVVGIYSVWNAFCMGNQPHLMRLCIGRYFLGTQLV